MELSKYLRDYSRTIPGKQQLLIGAYAKALEIIPRQLCDNAGFDATNILNKLRARHAQVIDSLLSLESKDWMVEGSLLDMCSLGMQSLPGTVDSSLLASFLGWLWYLWPACPELEAGGERCHFSQESAINSKIPDS